ncbi:DNA-binding protein Alba [Candidatus Micrarchaeota archaeon]|nr:MAG: DNA-binding protein Alba [Candidatus Micrarchaeota archaeon]
MAEEEKNVETKEESGDAANTVFVGKKGVMSYVLAVVTQFNKGAKEVNIKARGKTISRAVDVAEIIKNKFINEVKVKNISIQTEELKNADGTTSKVSAIDIVLSK